MVRRGAVTCGPATSQGGGTALLWAAQGGHKNTVKLLLDRGADLEAKNNVKLQMLFSLPCSWSAGDVRNGCIEQDLESLSPGPKEIAFNAACHGESLDCGCFGQLNGICDRRLAKMR